MDLTHFCSRAHARVLLLCSAIAVGATGCVQSEAGAGVSASGSRSPRGAASIPSSTLTAKVARAGVDALYRGDYETAVREFSAALRRDPTNPHLHYLNGLAYQLWAESGDPTQYTHAASGFRLALRFDPANAWASYQLGRIDLARRNYRSAEDNFSQALLIDPDNAEFARALVAAAYYAGDIETAVGAVADVERLAPHDPWTARAGALVRAAANDAAGAADALDRFSTNPSVSSDQRSLVSGRLGDWRRFHDRAARIIPTALANTSDSPAPANAAPASAATPPRPGPRMVQIDAVIIRSEERVISGKGLNLLDGLRLTFSATPIDWSRNFVQTPSVTSDAQSVNVKLTSPDIPYSLNIFNDSEERNEVLAQPSLLAADNIEADFFSGANLYVAIAPNSGYGTMEEVKVGLKLSVTPRFLDDNTIEMNATIEREFFEPTGAGATFAQSVETATTQLTTHATLHFDETLIVSGLSERETEKARDGVPVLQSIPVVQYAFSRKDEQKFIKSVLVLLTPRRVRFIDDAGTRLEPAAVGADPASLRELKAQTSWFKPGPNIDPVMQRLRASSVIKEFRLEDLPLETWHTPDRLAERLKRAIGFLYY